MVLLRRPGLERLFTLLGRLEQDERPPHLRLDEPALDRREPQRQGDLALLDAAVRGEDVGHHDDRADRDVRVGVGVGIGGRLRGVVIPGLEQELHQHRARLTSG